MITVPAADALSRYANVSLLFWDIIQRPLYESPAHYAVNNANLQVNDRIIAFQLPNDKNPKPVLTVYKRLDHEEKLPCKSKPCESIEKLFKVIKIRRPNLVIVDMGKDVQGMDLRPLRILCKQVGARLMVHVTKVTNEAKPLFQYCNILTWTGLYYTQHCTISFVKKGVSAINLTGMPPFNPFISKNTSILAVGLRQKGFECTFGNPLRHELVVDAKLAQDITQEILEMVFVTDQPISLISNIQKVASGTVSFDTINLTLLGLDSKDLAEVVNYLDCVFYVVDELSKIREQNKEFKRKDWIEFKLAKDIKHEVKNFCDLFID